MAGHDRKAVLCHTMAVHPLVTLKAARRQAREVLALITRWQSHKRSQTFLSAKPCDLQSTSRDGESLDRVSAWFNKAYSMQSSVLDGCSSTTLGSDGYAPVRPLIATCFRRKVHALSEGNPSSRW